ncbi:OprO/OprP family phosphate-selective porin [Opitutales bacterium]|nr:OprO/OprP family phosphate-selective porin [Opitutales bacterium]
MNKRFAIAHLCLPLFLTLFINAQENKSNYEKIWDKVVLYENDENSLVSKFWLTGRLQGEYHSFENEVAPAIDHDDYDWRRFRFGFKATLFGDITLHSEADLGLENRGRPLYNDLTDTYFSWSTENGMKFKLGKQSAPFTLDGSTSSKKLYTLERSKIAGNIWFGQEYFPGISVSGSKDEIDYFAGYYSNDNKPEFDGAFKHGQFGILSVGKDYAANFDLEKSYLRLDFMYQDDDGNDDVEDFNDWNAAYSFVTKWENNDWYFWTDLSFADRKNGDIWGIQLMPFYDITDKTQAIFCYTHLESSGDNQLRASRWEDRLDRGEFRGDDLTEYFFGLNHFFYGHKLKWQNGLQYTELNEADGSKEYEGWGFTTAFRISW